VLVQNPSGPEYYLSTSGHRLKFWIGLGISAVFLFLALHDVAWADVWEAWTSARVALLLAGTILLVASWVISAVRWRILLAPAPGLRVRDTFAYICIGYLANTVLPLRLGDLTRATLIGRNKGLGISRSLGSMAFERVLDLLALLGIALALTWLMEIPPLIKTGVASMTGLAIGGLVFLMIISWNKKRLEAFAVVLGRFLPDALAKRISTLLANFTSGVDALRRPWRLLAIATLSMLLWGCAGLAAWAWAGAFHLVIPWFAPFFVLVVINLGSAIPSSPGYIGVYHYLAVLALSVWIPDRGPALAYAIGTHALNMLANVSLGAFFLAREGVSLRELRREA
jgi:uncharacterized protein (TIRG00374 family)